MSQTQIVNLTPIFLKYLEPVISVIIYHGKSKWDTKKDLSSIFYDGNIFQKYLPKL